MDLMAAYDVMMKAVIVGNSGVGKSCVLARYVEGDSFNMPVAPMSTIGVDFKIRLLDIRNRVVKLQLWDTAGQERFRSITASYYKSADAVILCYDVSDPESLHAIEAQWLPEVRRLSRAGISLLIMGNKSDKEYSASTVQEAETIAQSIGARHVLCSALLDGCMQRGGV